MGYRETRAGEGSRFTTKTGDRPRCLRPEGAWGWGRVTARKRPLKAAPARVGWTKALRPFYSPSRVPHFPLATPRPSCIPNTDGFGMKEPPPAGQRCRGREGRRVPDQRRSVTAPRLPRASAPAMARGGRRAANRTGKRDLRSPAPLTFCRARRRRSRSGHAVAGS